VNVRNLLIVFACLLVLKATPADAVAFYFGDTVWQNPNACTGNVYTQHLCFPYGASQARTPAERQAIAPYLARGYPASDLLFVGNRQPTITVDIVVTGWVVLVTGSQNGGFANRTNRELSVLIDGTLSHFGMSTNGMPAGTMVFATFGDGSKAVFKLEVTGGTLFTQPTREWKWTGDAWNAEGFEIDRTGNMRYPITGPPTYEPAMNNGARRIGSQLGSATQISGPFRAIEVWTQTVSVSGGGSSKRSFIRVVGH
jgi:hypothetical protein